MIFHQLKEGEFRKIAETKSITKLVAQESEKYPNKFHLIGIDQVRQIGYAIRHGRTEELRVWRLDVLVNQIKSMGFEAIDVQLLKSE
ncbi:hypothetical protein AAFX24_17405 [Vibrio mediterranei]|uniref:hypothetical protein n=1 Tax=Vibrio mediterranei TaxID=689 RepID=UPI0038CE6B4C